MQSSALVKETKEQRFKRIASKRTEKVLDALRKLGNCSNRGIYGYSNGDVTKVFSAVDSELKRIKVLFNSKARSNKFTLL
ncbi:MAG: hypothetical protein KKC39_01040 [Candidatus Omnitrophica bacterium]|nr:hypothetical protein [Candidatus Omnitrophota bacterium]